MELNLANKLTTKINDWVSDRYLSLQTQGALRNRYLQTDPYEHYVLDNFLKPDAFQYLLTNAGNTKKEVNSSRMGLSKERPILWGLLQDETAIRFIYGAEFRNFITTLVGEPARIQKGSLPQLTEFLPGSKGFSMHNDEGEPFDLVFLLYLKSEGASSLEEGAFCVHDNKEKNFLKRKVITPVANRALLFKVAPNSHHSVNDLGVGHRRLNLTLDWSLPNSSRELQRQLRLQKAI